MKTHVELPSEVLVSLLLTIIVQEQGVSSLEALFQALPSLSKGVLLITDHESESPYALLNAPKVPHVSLDQYDSSPALRLAYATRLRIFSFMKHTNNLVTQKFNASLKCLYGRHLSHLTPVLVNVQKSAERDIFYWTMKSLASRAHVPIVIPLASSSTNRNLSFLSRCRGWDSHSTDKTSFNVKDWKKYISGLPPYFETWREEPDLVTSMISMVCPAMVGLTYSFGSEYMNLKTLNVDFHPANGLYHGPPDIGLLCVRPFLILCCKDLKTAYLSFSTCMIPCVVLDINVWCPDFDIPNDLYFPLAGFRQGNFVPSDQAKLPSVLDEFTLENKLWSIHYPYSNTCFYASTRDGPRVSQAEWSFTDSGVNHLYWQDFVFHSQKVSLVGVPAVLVFHRLQLNRTTEFSWWKLSPDLPVRGKWWGSLKPKQCPCLLKLKVFAVVRDRKDDPPLMVDAPLLKEIQLVGLVTSEKPWDLNELLQNRAYPGFSQTLKNKILKAKVSSPPIPGSRLKKVMLGQYSTSVSLSVDYEQLSPAITTVETLAIVGYIPQFVMREAAIGACNSPIFYSLKSFTLDITWITQYAPTTITPQINLCERVHPSLLHLKLVVPQQSWCKFEDLPYDDHCYHSLELKIEVPKRTKHITLSSVLLGITVNVNGCQLLKINRSSIHVNGVEYTWTKRNEPQVGFQQDLEFEGASFAEEWDFDNCIYDTYKPPEKPCKHLHRGLKEEL